MTLTQISVLLAVVDSGSFTVAGKQRFMSQSAVSQAIAALEEELGIPLLQRERRKEACLTPVGERIVTRMRAILHEVNAVKELAEQEKRLPARQLRVGSFPSVCASILPYVVRYFEMHHPQVKIIPHEANSAEIIDAVRSQQLDAGFVHFPVREMYSFPVYKDKFTAVVPDNHLFSQRTSLQLEDLFEEALIISKGRYEMSIMSLFAEQNITPK